MGGCLGVGRPNQSGMNPRLLASNLVDVDASLLGPPSAAQLQIVRLNGTRSSYLTSGTGNPSSTSRSPMTRLFRQTHGISGVNNRLQTGHNPNSQAQTIPKLVDIDESSFDNPNSDNSHLNCNRKTVQLANEDLKDVSPHVSQFLRSLVTKQNEIRVFIALYDYEPKAQDDLGFVKGEHLETTTPFMGPDWWFLVRSKTTKKIGYIPSNFVAALKSPGSEPWYFGGLGRLDAENGLKTPGNCDGSFIIRKSPNPHPYSLSVLHQNDVKHYRIKDHEEGGFYIDRKKVFSTIHDLVAHYSTQSDGLCCALGQPCTCKFGQQIPSDTCDQYEIDRNRITLLNELGKGQFGQVYEGLLEDRTRCAIKTLRKGSMDPQDFLAEAQIMKKMKHPNLVELYAVCTREEPVYIITELMSKGALNSYLQTPEGKNLPMTGCIMMATQIAAGMSYLEREKYVHRDLAARNILVGENNICKIADFGLARFIKESEYEARAGARFPIKWTAPEAAKFSRFTIKSDVWSYGIVLYEIVTKGGTPYPDLTNADISHRLEKGYRMPQPPNCEPKYYAIMMECWHKDPNRRPTFDTLHWKMADYFSSEEQYREASQFRER